MTDDTYHAFMLDHASGALNSELRLAGDLHVALNHGGARTSEFWNVVGGILLEDLHEGEPDSVGHNYVSKSANTRAVAHRLTKGEYGVKWRKSLFGFETASLGSGMGRLLRLAPGKSVPEHGHSRFEATVILAGAFDDGQGVFRRGDIVFSTADLKHKPASVGDEDCICYVGREDRRNLIWPF